MYVFQQYHEAFQTKSLVVDDLLEEVAGVDEGGDVDVGLLDDLPDGALVRQLDLVHLALREAPRVPRPPPLDHQNLHGGQIQVQGDHGGQRQGFV